MCDVHHHVDHLNIGASLITSFGDFEGGDFLTDLPSGRQPIALRGHPLYFDGLIQHGSDAFQGTYGSVVAYTHRT